MWPVVKLGELASREDSAAIAIGPFGSRMKADSYVPTGVPVIRGQNLSDSGGIAGEYVHITSEFATSLGSANLLRDDIVFPHRGAIGRVARVPSDGYVMSTSLMRIRLDPLFADPRFVVAYFGSDLGRTEILQFASTVGTPGIGQPLTSLRQFQMPLPPLDEQRRIAEVLGALDDLIDTNERQHEQLLALAFSVFHRAAFAAPLVELRHLGVAASRGVTPKYSADADSVVVVNQKCIRGFRVDLNQARRMEGRQARPEKVASPGDTLVNSTGVGTLGRSSRWLGKTDVNVDSHVTVVKAVRPEESAFVSYAVMSQVNNIEALAEGSTGQTELSKERLLGLSVPNLDGPLIASVGRALDELDQARSALLDEVRTLRRTRDELLPLLMSGKVRVRVEGVAA